MTLCTCDIFGFTSGRGTVLATASFVLKLPFTKPARVMSPVESEDNTTGAVIFDSREIVLDCTPARRPMREPKSSPLAVVSNRTSIFRPSGATKVTPFVSEPVSTALTPVLSVIMLMARTTSARVWRELFKEVVISALAYPLINTVPLTTEVPVIALPDMTFSLTFAKTPVPA